MSQFPNLTLLKDGAVLKTFSLEGDLVLGRADECAIRIDDRAVSRQHAVFKSVSGSVQVEKRSEFAPLSVNGAEVTQAVLKVGDLVSIGPYVGLPEPPPPAPTESPSAGSDAKPASTDAAGVEGISTENSEALPGGELAGAGDLAGSPSLEEVPGMSSDPAAAPGMEGGVEQPSGDAQQGSGDPPPPAEAEPIDEDGKTKITPTGKVSVRLIFKQGTANVTDFEITKDVIYIGRGKDCDIVLNDKKASRKNSMIRKSGLSYIIKDLGSSNGTYINGAKVQEQELSGDDVIRIGNVEFSFKAMSTEYLAQEKDLVSIPVEEGAADAPGAGLGDLIAPDAGAGQAAPGGGLDLSGSPAPGTTGDPAAAVPGAVPGVTDIPGLGGIPGIGGAATGSSGKKKSLIERFRALPKRTQTLVVIVLIGAFYWLSEDDNSPLPIKKKTAAVKKATATAPSGQKGPLVFDMLTPEQKKFVELQHTTAFEHFRNRDYDKALYEIRKIFQLINDYKDAREIERYAEEGKRKMDQIEEEKKRKKEEEALKAKVAQLVEECRQRMEKKEFEQAREYFIQILGLDPDNAAVGTWRKEIEAFEEQQKLKEQQKQVEIEINKHGWALFAEATQLKKKKHYHDAIATYQKSIDIGVTDPKLAPLSKSMIAVCRKAIGHLRDPVLRHAKEAEDANEYAKAFALYKKATRIDPPHPAGYAGMNRIRKVLHEQAKVSYTEAILAESYSDFENAKKMFQETLTIAPSDDIYHERAARKLSRYIKKKEEGGAQ
ncbi:MAG: FHA domain-containing protein [Bdellovibrio sp.]|nr:FHA domain-containing protein [Bdellovibrio sp.]